MLIGRPFAIAAHGGGQEGVRVYAEHVTFQLKETMRITGCRTLADITKANIRNLNNF